jgi:hypothetical protein
MEEGVSGFQVCKYAFKVCHFRPHTKQHKSDSCLQRLPNQSAIPVRASGTQGVNSTEGAGGAPEASDGAADDDTSKVKEDEQEEPTVEDQGEEVEASD